MSKPKNMTPEQEAAWREKAREATRRWREANPEKDRERRRRWRAANPEKDREADRRRRAANPEKERELLKRWRANNPEKARENNRHTVESLAPSYIAGILEMPIKDCTPELIEAKRAQIQLHRLTLKLKKELQNVK